MYNGKKISWVKGNNTLILTCKYLHPYAHPVIPLPNGSSPTLTGALMAHVPKFEPWNPGTCHSGHPAGSQEGREIPPPLAGPSMTQSVD